jgi:hypothetical protein
MRFAVGVSMAMGLLLSPEALLVLGNSMGGIGFGALVALAVAALVTQGTVCSYTMLAAGAAHGRCTPQPSGCASRCHETRYQS